MHLLPGLLLPPRFGGPEVRPAEVGSGFTALLEALPLEAREAPVASPSRVPAVDADSTPVDADASAAELVTVAVPLPLPPEPLSPAGIRRGPAAGIVTSPEQTGSNRLSGDFRPPQPARVAVPQRTVPPALSSAPVVTAAGRTDQAGPVGTPAPDVVETATTPREAPSRPPPPAVSADPRVAPTPLPAEPPLPAVAAQGGLAVAVSAPPAVIRGMAAGVRLTGAAFDERPVAAVVPPSLGPAAVVAASVAPPPVTTLPTPATQPEWAGDLAEMLLDNVPGEGISRARLQIRPEALGGLAIEIRQEGDQVELRVQVETATARQLFEDSLPRLRTQFSEQGLTLTQAHVGQGGPQSGERDRHTGTAHRDDRVEEAAPPPGSRQSVARGLLDHYA